MSLDNGNGQVEILSWGSFEMETRTAHAQEALKWKQELRTRRKLWNGNKNCARASTVHRNGCQVLRHNKIYGSKNSLIGCDDDLMLINGHLFPTQ